MNTFDDIMVTMFFYIPPRLHFNYRLKIKRVLKFLATYYIVSFLGYLMQKSGKSDTEENVD